MQHTICYMCINQPLVVPTQWLSTLVINYNNLWRILKNADVWTLPIRYFLSFDLGYAFGNGNFFNIQRKY